MQNQLWVDKYKPQNCAELVGNNTLLATLREWLQNWEDVHLHGQAPGQVRGGGAEEGQAPGLLRGEGGQWRGRRNRGAKTHCV